MSEMTKMIIVVIDEEKFIGKIIDLVVDKVDDKDDYCGQCGDNNDLTCCDNCTPAFDRECFVST